MPQDALQFYQQLAQDYHLIYADWDRAIDNQGTALDRVIRARRGDPPADLLDCSAGIGTQALGLAARGYTVHASDISPAAVERALHEAAAKGIALTASVADMRALAEQVPGEFDVVISCDNAVPHLMTDADLLLAIRNFRAKLRPDGLLLISIRDYDHLLEQRPNSTQPRVFDDANGRRIVFQVWDWADDNLSYTITLFILRQHGDSWHTATYATTYRALRRSELTALLEQSGFGAIRWHMPQDTGYYQPLVIATPAG